MSTTTRKLLSIGLLSLCATALGGIAQSQTASPGPNSRNANVDKEDPNKPDTPEHEIPAQGAPGTGGSPDAGTAGTTPTGGDGSSATTNRDPTQHTQGNKKKERDVKHGDMKKNDDTTKDNDTTAPPQEPKQ